MGDETRTKPGNDVMQPILDFIKQNVAALAPVIARGDIAVVVFELSSDTLVQQAVRDIGWNGAAPVFKLLPHHRQRLIERSEEHADLVTANWLRGGRTGRIFLWTGRGTLLINFQPGVGYSIEPGSLDASRAKA